MTKAPTKITAEQVRRLGELAKLNVPSGDEDRLREELSSVLGYFDVVDKVEGSEGAEGEAAPGPGELNLRPDIVQPSQPAGVLRGVPQKRDRLVKAPRVF